MNVDQLKNEDKVPLDKMHNSHGKKNWLVGEPYEQVCGLFDRVIYNSLQDDTAHDM